MTKLTFRILLGGVALGALGAVTGPAFAGPLAFELVASYSKPGGTPYGLAFDGTNIWYGSLANALIREMTTSGVDTGRTTVNPLWGEPGVAGNSTGLAWNGSQLVAASADRISYFDRITGGNRTDTPITAAVPGIIMGAGLDFDHNEIWYDQDRSNVFRLTADGSLAPGPNPVLAGGIGGSGAYSAVERVDVDNNSFLIVMTAAFQVPPPGPNPFPFRICQETLSGIEMGCADFSRGRYFDFAFDGRYLYGASATRDAIDKFDLIGPNGSILAPEPGSLCLLCLGLLVLRRARSRQVTDEPLE